MVICYAASVGKPEVFLRIWQHFKHEIKLEHLRVQAQKGEDEGKSVLWLLAVNPEAFKAIWDTYKDEMTAEEKELLVEAARNANDREASESGTALPNSNRLKR